MILSSLERSIMSNLIIESRVYLVKMTMFKHNIAGCKRYDPSDHVFGSVVIGLEKNMKESTLNWMRASRALLFFETQVSKKTERKRDYQQTYIVTCVLITVVAVVPWQYTRQSKSS
jgi:hypothetical protein